jgi:hypothetical protein
MNIEKAQLQHIWHLLRAAHSGDEDARQALVGNEHLVEKAISIAGRGTDPTTIIKMIARPTADTGDFQ